ncbi:MAG: queuine tRNA-ribosyltransferase [Chloroflexota bacterium]|jgi:queuine tRNA-ribosyltransferase|nr:queuine tRNA-ribosyltransferase [Chloroflexota bacterium]
MAVELDTNAVSRPMSFDILLPPPADGSTRARLGHLTTPHGEIQTPVFMPVGTNATVKALDPDDLDEVGAQIILCNTYHLYLRPGHERIARLGGLHKFMSWQRPILTDSGGYQVVSLGDYRSVDDEGVTFRSHLDGSIHKFTPEHSIAVQEALGSDIAVVLDQPVPPHASTRREVAEAMVRTHSWAERCLTSHKRPDQALFGIVQGGLEADLRAESAQVIASMPFDGICIGGLAGDESAAQRLETLDIVVPLLAQDPRPRYLMGLGSPADLLDAVDAGIDMFDSVLPARIARNGTVWTPEGRLNLRNSRFLDDPAPLQEGCRCRACRSFSRAYLAHLLRAEELLFYRLATLHNLTYLADFMARIRQALAAGKFPKLRAELAVPEAPPSIWDDQA